MSDKGTHDIDERLKALINNAAAARVVTQAVEGTIGPRGLDTMMVDSFGDVVITNDGVTILKWMEINHPAAQMVINAARAQQADAGDGTTTATIMAGTMISEGASQVLKGVPVAQVIDGIRRGVAAAEAEIKAQTRPAAGFDDPLLYQTARIAGRGDESIARLVLEAARETGMETLKDPVFKLADQVVGNPRGDSELLAGVIVSRGPVNRDMPETLDAARILVLDDYLRPEEFESEALHTEAGFKVYQELREQYRRDLDALAEAGVSLVLTSKNIDDLAESVLTEAGILVIQRASHHELEHTARHTGARIVKRKALQREPEQISKYLGSAKRVEYREELAHFRISGGAGQQAAAILVGAVTAEVVEERERIARDAAAAVQKALLGGVVPGGGSIELWAAQRLEAAARETGGLPSYGVLCVKEALERPFACIVGNAGFNPLEKLVAAVSRQQETGQPGWAVDCETGEIRDMTEIGVFDPTPVKLTALTTAGEVAAAILRINTVVKKRDAQKNGASKIEW
ncbi:MAG: TCP-1/cpn60 chaperonin family protein [Solirubrobacterales bacterium]